MIKNISIYIFCLFALFPDKKVPEQANGSINLINKCPRNLKESIYDRESF